MGDGQSRDKHRWQRDSKQQGPEVTLVPNHKSCWPGRHPENQLCCYCTSRDIVRDIKRIVDFDERKKNDVAEKNKVEDICPQTRHIFSLQAEYGDPERKENQDGRWRRQSRESFWEADTD
ncbi:hypothetical protein PSCLAVI8L_80107 [Pseudoclavibacter sp. 8L]|nr:hypothetical protein PSCLAVI8L_80107 [Pseudoclavibacter sp. 8L]